MGSRGLFGFYYQNKYYVVYNHFDSYPEGLGKQIVDEIKQAIKDGKLNEWENKLQTIKIIDTNIDPTLHDIKKLYAYTDLSVSSQSQLDWYCLLRKTQGSLKKVIKSGYMINSVDADGSPIFEQYAYILNFDTSTFDYYERSRCIQKFEWDDLPNW